MSREFGDAFTQAFNPNFQSNYDSFLKLLLQKKLVEQRQKEVEGLWQAGTTTTQVPPPFVTLPQSPRPQSQGLTPNMPSGLTPSNTMTGVPTTESRFDPTSEGFRRELSRVSPEASEQFTKSMMFGMPKYGIETAGNTVGRTKLNPFTGEAEYTPLYSEQPRAQGGEWTVPDVPEERKNPAGGWERKMIKKDASGNTYTKWESMNEPPSQGGMYSQGTEDDIEQAAKAVANYDANLSTLPRQDKTRILSRAMAINPKFSQNNYEANKRLKESYTSGKYSQNIVSLNTAIGHLGDLKTAAEALKNGDIQLLNALAVAWGRQMGESAPDQFEAVRDAVANELATTFKGSSGTDIGLQNILKTMYSKQSPEQAITTTRAFVKLLDSRLQALNSNYKKQTGVDFPVLDEDKKAIIDQINANNNPSSVPTDEELDKMTPEQLQEFLQRK